MKNNNESKEQALHYFKTLVEVAREAFLILDSKLRVISANPIFYDTFKVAPGETEGESLYDLGNGQWNIPELKGLLEEILPNKKVVRDYQMTHTFESIGEKTMELNARQIDTVQLIILAIEDITVRKNLETKLVETVKSLNIKVDERTIELKARVKELELTNKSMVGRELKMMELKKQIAALENELKKTKS